MIKKNNCTNLVDGIVISVKSKGLDWPSVITVEYEINNIKYQIKESIKLKSTIIKLDNLIDDVDIPVILGGSLRDMKSMNDVLNNTNVEFMSMSKPFVAQADFLADWKTKGDGLSICQSCNNCYSKKTSTCFKYGTGNE